MWRIMRIGGLAEGGLHEFYCITQCRQSKPNDISKQLPYLLAYKSHSRISRIPKIESTCSPKSLTRVSV